MAGRGAARRRRRRQKPRFFAAGNAGAVAKKSLAIFPMNEQYVRHE
jgi:hypothetical protein